MDARAPSCDARHTVSFVLDPPLHLDLSVPCSPELAAERLGARLTAVATFVPEGSIPVDVGTDHARLLIALVRSGRCPTGIGVDVAEGPYRRAKRAVAGAAMSHLIAVRHGDGLAPVDPGEADVAVLAGFGGRTANAVLAAACDRLPIRRWVVQVNRDVPAVRRSFEARGLAIVDEALVFDDGRVFVVMAAEAGEMALSDADAWLGPRLRVERSPLFVAWVRSRRDHLRALAAKGHLSGKSREELSIVEAELPGSC